MNESEAKQVVQCVRENFPTSKLRTTEVEAELMRRLMGLKGVSAAQGMACVRDYRFTDKGFQPNTLWDRLKLLGREAKAKTGGTGDPNTWPLWRRYQAWMSKKMPPGADEPGGPLEWIAFWHRCLMRKYESSGAMDRAVSGFVHDLLRERMAGTVEEALAMAEQHLGEPSAELAAWLMRKHSVRAMEGASP